MNEQLAAKLDTLPRSPGVYFHKDSNGEVIYVGKASVLKNRVRQYFNHSSKDHKTIKLVQNIAMTDWIETDSEIDALFLENEMIKRYKPKYNILLRDDKNCSYVRIDFAKEWPTVTITRVPLDDKASYVGPFYDSTPVKRALRYLRRSFPYLIKETDRRSALLQQLHLTPTSSSKDYRANLHVLARYLKGERATIQKELEQHMKQAAANLDYEQAAQLRNKLFNLNELKKQIIFSRDEFMDISKDKALLGAKQLFCLDDVPKRIEAYDISHQSGQNVVGSMVVITNGVADKREYRKFRVSRSRNNDTAAMAEVVSRRFSPRHSAWPRPNLLIVDGGLPQINAVSEQVNGLPVVGISKNNDEIIVSKLSSHINTDRIKQLLNASPTSVRVINQQHYYSINLHAGSRHSKGHSFSFIGESSINSYTDLLKLVQRLRDEAHRFAINYHQVAKRQQQTNSCLTDIPGVGPAITSKLLKQFGSLSKIKSASLSELSIVVGPKVASRIKTALDSSAT